VNIAVCVKQVPSTETKIRVSTQLGLVDTSEVDWVINPFDEYALELALRIKEALGGTLAAFALGPERVKTALRTSLAMGCDAAFQLTDPAFDGIDSLAVGRALAAAVTREKYDLVFCGKQAIDDDMGAVGAALAHFAGLPHVAAVAAAEVTADGGVIAHREVEGATEVVHVRTPVLLTVGKAKYDPRLPNLKGMMAAKKKEIPLLGCTALGLDPARLTRRVESLGDRLPPGRKPGRVIDGDPAQAVPELVRLLHEEAKVV
jgi:electron transfer flavoprotein beta subunit